MSHGKSAGQRGSTFVVSFAAVTVTAVQDVFEIVAPSTSKLAIREVVLGQYSDVGDAAAEIISVAMLRGYTTSGSGGSSATPVNLAGHTGAKTSAATAEINNTTIAADGTGVRLRSEAWNVQMPYRFYPAPCEQIIVNPSERFVVRISAPADALSMNGTLVFEEIGLY